MTWDEFFFGMADYVRVKSKDRSTSVGAVIVDPESRVGLSFGYNGFVRGCDDTILSRHARPEKYLWTEHAERNAIYNAARHGVRLGGSMIYTTMFPCAECARAIVQSGIREVVTVEPDAGSDLFERWSGNFHISNEMFRECGVTVTFAGKIEKVKK